MKMMKIGLIPLILLIAASRMAAEVLKTQEEALQEAFAAADTVIRQTLFLSEREIEQMEESSKSKFNSAIITYYLGIKDADTLGYAFFEDQIVRTKKTIVMILISPHGKVRKVEVLAFMEPMDYLPVQKWFDLFLNQILSNDLWPGRSIHAVTGATLSVRTFTLCVRRALAVYHHLHKHH